MFSICIPIYNYDVRPLVRHLHQQVMTSGQAFEIILLDDCSDKKFQLLNAALKPLKGVKYEVLPENIGRSAIRNRLGEMAKYDWLIFMDCDSACPDDHYLKRYVDLMQGHSPPAVFYGGRIYHDLPPKDPSFLLHWHYGTRREQSTAKERKSHPYQSFMTNNFAIDKNTFLTIKFEEKLKQYGHEDTLFGIELKKRAVPIFHFDNPLIHVGLESGEHFISKTKQGIENLIVINELHGFEDTKLWQTTTQLEKWGLAVIIRWIYKKNRDAFDKIVLNNPSALHYFDLLKLGYLLHLKNQK